MAHGDNRGLKLPPRVAPIQAVIVPVASHKEGVKEKAQELYGGTSQISEGLNTLHSALSVLAEKSVLLDDGYYGKYSNTVACCGSSFNKYHISMLTDILGASEIIIALDKEYTDWRTEKARKYKSRIEKMCKQYTNYTTFSYIWDYDNVLEEKDSPFDKGKDVFEHLYKTRVKIK